MNAAAIARVLGGKRAGRQWLCRCPAHDDSKPSLSITDGDKDILVKCHAGCDSHDVLAELRRRALWPDTERCSDHKTLRLELHRSDRVDDGTDKRTKEARALFGATLPLRGTVAELYLIRRGINTAALPSSISDTLRFHPSCPFNGARHPCLVALFTDAITGEPRAIHRTALSPTGDKLDRRNLGPMAGCVIRLWPDDAIEQGLVLGEGLETTLAAATRIVHRGTLLQPAWAAASAGSMSKFPVLSGISNLTLLVDHDASGAGQQAAEECSRRWTASGREVLRLVPRAVGDDFNDIARRAYSERLPRRLTQVR